MPPGKPRTPLGEALRARREELGLGQAEAATLLGVSAPTVCAWEMGRKIPPKERREVIAGFLGYDPFESRSRV